MKKIFNTITIILLVFLWWSIYTWRPPIKTAGLMYGMTLLFALTHIFSTHVLKYLGYPAQTPAMDKIANKGLKTITFVGLVILSLGLALT